jgi:hypothetical protein
VSVRSARRVSLIHSNGLGIRTRAGASTFDLALRNTFHEWTASHHTFVMGIRRGLVKAVRLTLASAQRSAAICSRRIVGPVPTQEVRQQFRSERYRQRSLHRLSMPPARRGRATCRGS